MDELKNLSFNFTTCAANYGELTEAISFLLDMKYLTNRDVTDMFNWRNDQPPVYYPRSVHVKYILDNYTPDAIIQIVNRFKESRRLNRYFRQGDVVEYLYRFHSDEKPFKGVVISIENDGDDPDEDMVVILDDCGNTDLFYRTEANHEIKKTGEHFDILSKLFNKESK